MELLSPRQIHLDFHTSPLIPAVALDFDPEAFAATAHEADVSSMTVFARCHHGLLYYDSKAFPERVHPHLKNRNLVLEQVEALRRMNIKAPIYITVQWDYYSANAHPEWLIRKRDGAHEGKPFTEPGFYQSLCVNTGYRAFLKAQTQEILGLLGDSLDGVFFDIVGIRPCWCASCREAMRKEGVYMNDDDQVRAFAKRSLDGFKVEMTALVRTFSKTCTIFYNAGHVGSCTRESADSFTHFELESLPSGGWGYLHFPVTARYARMLGKDCLGMTGKFHMSWGDFHSLKNQAALEFEAFRMLSFGFACSIGDQLPPSGRLNPATYRLIGSVFSRFKACEAWARPSSPLTEAALLTGENPLYEHRMPDSILGAVQLLEELAIQFDILDDSMALEGYRVVILPDDFTATADFQKKLDAYVAKGGAVLACHHGGMSDGGIFPACFPAQYEGETAEYPDFFIAEGPLSDGLEPGNEYVIYKQGARLSKKAGKAMLHARAPYFAREGGQFCSHSYTPSAEGEPYPVAFQNGQVLQMAHPLFTQYRDNAPRWVKTLAQNALRLLLPDQMVEHDGPSTLTVQLLEQPKARRVCAHILSYIPIRKSATIDIIEDRTRVRDVTLRLNLSHPFTKARLVPEDVPLTMEGGSVKIPVVDGYAVVEIS